MKSVQTPLALILAGLLWIPQGIWAQSSIDRVLVAVDNVPLTLSEYRVRHRQEIINGAPLDPFEGQVDSGLLERMINERLQLAQAQQRGLSVADTEIDAAVAFIAQQNNLPVERLVSRLERGGLSESDLRNNVRDQQLIQKLVNAVANSRVVVSDQEIENFLNARDEYQVRAMSFEISHLLVETGNKSESQLASDRENLQLIRQRVLDGLPFDQAARDYSDSLSGEAGGYLGWRNTDQLPELFVRALENLDPASNRLSPVLEGGNGLHLLMLHDRKEEGEMVEQQWVQHILISPDEQNNLEESRLLAMTIYDQLADGEPFEKMARLYSMDGQSRNEGGSLGWVNPGTLVPAVENAAKELPIGEVSRPVLSPYGLHLIRVMDRRKVNWNHEMAVDRARQEIFRRKSEEVYFKWLQSIRQRAFIEYVDAPKVSSN